MINNINPAASIITHISNLAWKFLNLTMYQKSASSGLSAGHGLANVPVRLNALLIICFCVRPNLRATAPKQDQRPLWHSDLFAFVLFHCGSVLIQPKILFLSQAYIVTLRDNDSICAITQRCLRISGAGSRANVLNANKMSLQYPCQTIWIQI